MSDDDRRLGLHRRISRRDFLDGLRVASGATLLAMGCKKAPEPAPAAPFAPEQGADYYPPARTGLRGSHDGSFEVAHQLRAGTLEPLIASARPTGERYDLVVVGAGISGLAAAHFYRKAHPGAKILLLDNHDDVGGHAKRNELAVSPRRTLIGYGGTQSIENPSQYSAVARALLTELTIDLPRLGAALDEPRYERLGLEEATWFDRATFGVDKLVKGEPGSPAQLAAAPLPDAARADLGRLYHHAADFYPGLTAGRKKATLARLSYLAFLRDVAKAAPEAIKVLQALTHDLYGVGIDAVPALDCWALGFPGFGGLGLGAAPDADRGDDGDDAQPGKTPQMEQHPDPLKYHFPDGNASVARLLVRALQPQTLPGTTMEDVVTARLDYARLDAAAASVRIRLNSTVVRVRHVGDPGTAREVVVTYVRGGEAHTVTAAASVLACWHVIIPSLCPELPAAQRGALADQVKVPLLYANAAIRNWQAFATLGVSEIYAPGGYFSATSLDFPVDLGAYRAARTPDEPIVVQLIRTPCAPGQPSRLQHRAGRAELLATPFEVLERNLRDQLQRMLGGGGFDVARDLVALTINRWSHGYSYEYNSLWDPDHPPGQAPCELARQRFGRIAIANADAGAYAYTNSAIDQAWRAVGELG